MNVVRGILAGVPKVIETVDYLKLWDELRAQAKMKKTSYLKAHRIKSLKF